MANRLLVEDAAQYASEHGLGYIGNKDASKGGVFMDLSRMSEHVVPAVRVGATMIDQTVILEWVLIQVPADEERRHRALFHAGVEVTLQHDGVYLAWACLTYGYQTPMVEGQRPVRKIYAFAVDGDHEDMDVEYLTVEQFCQTLEHEWLARLRSSPG